VGDGDDPHAGAPRRQPADEVGLVAVAAQHVGAAAAQVLGHLGGGAEHVRRVRAQRHRLEAVRGGAVEERPRPAALRERQEHRPAARPQHLGQPQHLPLGAADERRRNQVDDVHGRSLSVVSRQLVVSETSDAARPPGPTDN
jgi:hypothetical protein